MRNIMNFLKITAVTLTMLFSGTSYGSLTQWDVTSSASWSGDWMFAGYVQGHVQPDDVGIVSVTITDFRFEYTRDRYNDVAVFSDPAIMLMSEFQVEVDAATGASVPGSRVEITLDGFDDIGYISTQADLWEHSVDFSMSDPRRLRFGGGVDWSAGRAVGVPEGPGAPPAANIPEPSIMALFGLGLAGIGFARRRQS
jgi:hypothetical protein